MHVMQVYLYICEASHHVYNLVPRPSCLQVQVYKSSGSADDY